MRKLITKEHVNQQQFYQMPKTFFRNPKYMPMRCEVKLAYMLMLDLLPLSIQNNWVNANDQVFVKLSRSKMMDLLNIKGTQKAAQVMKELVDYGLIVNKRIGLTRCNEIYLYMPESYEPADDSGGHRPNVHSDHQPSPQQPNPDHTATLDEDIEEVNALLEDQIHIEDLKAKYDPDFVEEIGHNICEMFMNKNTRIGKQNKPMSIIRSVIRELKMHHIEHVIDQFRKVAAKSEIVNTKRYIQTMIYNSFYETNSKNLSNIRYNFGYC